jgi:hypothetical protein
VTYCSRKLLLLSTVVLVACGGPGQEPPPEPLEGELVLGSAALTGTGFVSVNDGAEVELIPGGQGGFHLWTSLRVQGVMGPLVLRREARLVADGSLILNAPRTIVEVPEDAMTDWWEAGAAVPSFMCPSPVGLQVFDVEIALTAELLDEDGEIVAEDHVVLLPRCPEGDQADWCANICAG